MHPCLKLNSDIINHPHIQNYIEELKQLVESLEFGIRNKKVQIFKLEFEIKKLKGE
jgi:hypothetical protein